MGCFGDCFDLGPPPDMIDSMPPPPLPSFLLPTSAIVALSGNDSQPCFTPFMCERSAGGIRENSGIEFIELSRKGQFGPEDTWLIAIISSCIGVILLGILLAIILMKCRDSYNYHYADSGMKQPSMSALGETHPLDQSKAHAYMPGTMLYPCMPHNSNTLKQMANDNRVLWATLTPRGTQHFVADPYPNDDHYEVIDYRMIKAESDYVHTTPRRLPHKSSFENTGFVDYEDPSHLLESYHLDDVDMDSGYQEPQEVMDTLPRSRSPRPLISSPTRIENPNITPLNMYPNRPGGGGGTLNKKTTINRRLSDVSSSYGSSNNM